MEALIRPIALLLTAALAACAGQPAANQKASQFGDIPVPDGMTFQEGPTQSNSYEAGGFRYADLRYYGNLSVAEVARFMKKGMGRHGWELESAKDETAEVDLVFKRTPDQARCRIWKDDAVTRMKVEVRTKTGTERD